MVHRHTTVFLALAAMTCAPRLTAAADLLGLYIGGALGQGTVEVEQIGSGAPLDFHTHHAGWKALLGIRPIAVTGAEFEYVNFGHPSRVISNNVNADAQVRGTSIFAFGYLPLPIPLLEVYGKVGIAHLQTTATASLIYPLAAPCNPSHPIPFTCGPEALHRTDNHFAWGAGAQVKFSKLAVRAEYERFSTGTGKPDLLSVGVTWTP